MDKCKGAQRSIVALPLLSFLIIQLVFIIPSNIIQAAPTASSSSQECPIFCRASQTSLLQYEVGEYIYNYESEVKTEVTLPKSESRVSKVKARVVLQVISPCDLLLTIRKAAVKTSGGQDEAADLEGSTVRFTLEDGLINTVCVAKNDPSWSANIKRSIISLLQNKALHEVSDHDILESDVSGRCPTRYSLSGANYVKTKKLNKCGHRQGGKTESRGVPYEAGSLNTNPFEESVQTCEQTLDNGIIRQVKCIETHQSNTPSQVETDIKTSISVSLTLVDSKKGVSKKALPQNLVKSSIFFDFTDSSNAARQAQAEVTVREILERLCDNIQPDGFTSQVPSQLFNLKKAFAHLSKDDTQKIYGEIEGGSLCPAQKAKFRKVFLDAAAFSGSDGAIALLSQLYSKGELDKVSKRYFYLYTTFAPRPHEVALESVLPLITGSGQDVSKRLLLAVSGLAHQYCKITNHNCLQNSAYSAVVDRIAEIAKENCRATDEDRVRVAIAALNALGNTDQLTEKAVSAISTCLDASNRVQVQALDAFRRDPCEPELKKQAQRIFGDKQEASNVRISAFLSNLRCLQPNDARKIQAVLDDEESVQVGGFVQSQLKNLLKSSSPSTQTLKSAARQLNHNLKWPKESRKFSSNYESSLFVPTANLGYSAEGNVIFSKESFIPRQLSANLTLDIFGHSYNALQVGIYLENFDAIQESVFGPHGEFPADEEVSSKSVINSILKRAQGSRSRRAVPGPVQLDRNGLQAIQQKVNSASQDAPGISDAVIRVFGTTISVLSINTERAPQVASNVRSKLETYVKGALRSSSKDIDFVQPLLFLNVELLSPTVAGFALLDTAEATTIPQLKYLKDYKSPSENGGKLDLDLKIESDVATTLRARSSVVGGPFEQGLELEANLRSGGAVNFLVHRDEKRFEAKVTFPHEAVRHLELTTNVVWTQRTPGKPERKADFRPSIQVMPQPEKCEDNTLNSLLGAVVGLQVCVSSNIKGGSDEKVLFSGKQYFYGRLQKIQPSMEGYSIVLQKEKSATSRSYELTLDTPGLPNRKISLTGRSVDDADGSRKLTVELETPSKAVSAKFDYERTNSESEKGIHAKLTLPTAVVSVQGRVKLTKSGDNEITYEPLLSLEYPGKKDGSTNTLKFLSGKVIRQKGKSLKFDLAHELPDTDLVSPLDIFLKGAVEVSRNGKDFKYQLEGIEIGARSRGQDGAPTPVLVFNGHAQRRGSRYESDADVKYGMDLEHHLTAHDVAVIEPGHVKLHTQVTSTRVFFLNFDAKADVRRDKEAGTYSSEYSLTYGPNDRPQWVLASKSNAVVLTAQNFDVQNELTFNFPVRNNPAEAYNIKVKSHVKNVVGEEQIVDLQYLSGDNGAKGKVILTFHRQAAKNNDFELRAVVHCHKVNGELTHTRKTAVGAEIPKGYTSSHRHETRVVSSSIGLDETKLVTVVNILNKEEKKGLSIQSTLTTSSGRKLTFDAAVRSADKYQAKIKVTADGTELALLEASVTKSQSPEINIKSVVGNTWVITLTREPKGEGSAVTKLDADILATGRQVTLDVTRSRQGDVRTLDADLKWDAKRDPSKSIQVHSVTAIRQGSILIDSKNDITVVGKKVQVNLDAKIPTEVKHGEHSVALTFVTSDSREFVIGYKNDLDITPEARKSQGQLSLNLPSQRLPVQQSLIKWTVRSVNPDLPRLIFDISADVEVNAEGEKTCTAAVQLTSSKENDRRTLHAKVDVRHHSEPHVVDATLTLGRKYLKTKIASQCQGRNTDIELEYDRSQSTENHRIRNVKYLFVNLPGVTKAQRIEGSITEDFEYNDIRSFSLKKKHDLALDGKPALNYEYAVSIQNGKLVATALFNSKGQPVLKLNLDGTVNAELVDVQGKVIHSGDRSVQVAVNVDRTNPLKHFEVSAEGTNHGFLVKLENPSGKTVSVKNHVRYLDAEGHKGVVEADFDLSEADKVVSLALLKQHEGRPDSKLTLRLAKTGEDTYQFGGEANYRGKVVGTDGNVKKAPGVFEGSANVNILGKKGSAEIKLAVQGTKRKLAILGGPEGQVHNIITLDYVKESTGTQRTYDGTFATELPALVFADAGGEVKGTFHSTLDKGEVKQFKHTAEFSLEPVLKRGSIDLDFLLNNNELLASAAGSIHLKDQSEQFRSIQVNVKREPGTLNTLFKVLRRNNLNASGQNRTYGLISETKGVKGREFDHTTKLVVGDENSDSLSVHVYGKTQGGDGDCEGGLDLNLPKRTVSVSAQKRGGREFEVSAWLDKKNHPEQKVNLAVEYEKLKNTDGAQGYSYKATLSHPTLAKALVVKRKVVRLGELTLLDSTTELDVFEDSNNKITIVALAKYTDASKEQVHTTLSIKSDGLGLFVEGEGDIRKEPGNPAVANLQYSYKNRNGELKSRKVELVLGREHQSILVGDRSNPELLLSRSIRSEHRRRRSSSDDNTIDVRYEIHLPGMKDTRLVDLHLHGSAPPHLNIKTFTSEAGRSFELAVGFPTERQLLLGVYRTLNNQQRKLAELSVALNTTQLLSVKARWDLEVIKEVLKTAAERFENTNEGVHATSEVYVNELSADIQQTLTKVAEALPKLGPLQQHLKTELQEIKQEWQEDPESQALSECVKAIVASIRSSAEPIQKLLQVLADAPEQLKKLAEQSPELVKAYEKLTKALKQARSSAFRTLFRILRPIVKEIQELINRTSTKVQGDLNETSENAIRKAKSAADNVLAKIVEALLSRVDDITRYLEESSASPEIKELALTILKYTVARVKGDAVDANASQQEIIEKARVAIKKVLGEILTVDIQNGVISALIPLPKPVNSLLDVRSAIRNAFAQKAKIQYRNRLTPRKEIAKQFLRDLVKTNALNAVTKALRTNAPPHSARATIIGSQYFQTFDGKLFHFEGHCQYLLAADFVHKDVTLAIEFANVDGVIQKSLILADEDQQVVINPDFTVTQSGGAGREGHHVKFTESSETVTVSLEHDELTVECNKALDVCTVDLNNGYYFGKVAGLLGTFNNEQYDDLRTPEGNPTSNPEAFAESWKLNQQCSESPVPAHSAPSRDAQSLCSSAFSSRWSPLSSCFKLSDPSEYNQICEDLSRENGWTDNRAVCATALAYSKTCGGISLGQLSVCTKVA